jgi:hypothetical protein
MVSTTHKIISNILLSRLTPYADEIIVIIRVDIEVTDQQMIGYSASYTGERMGV